MFLLDSYMVYKLSLFSILLSTEFSEFHSKLQYFWAALYKLPFLMLTKKHLALWKYNFRIQF